MRRREFLTLAGAVAVAWATDARAQASTLPVIGFLSSVDPVSYAPQLKALHLGLQDHGYAEGRNLSFEYRWARGRNELLPALAAELVDRKVDVIVTHGAPAALALKRATSTVPVVMAAIGDPVDWGLVPSLARPGGNLTGLSFFVSELNAKRLELLKDLKPDLARAGVLLNVNNPAGITLLTRMAERMSAELRIPVETVMVRGPDSVARDLAEARPRIDGLTIPEDALFISNAARIAEVALEHKLPVIGFRELCQAGGLAAYGVDFNDLWRKAAGYVVKILKGAKPAELPIDQATGFELTINLKTAKALDLAIPELLHVRADELIE